MINSAVLDQIAYSWPWYIVRASGLTAAVLLILLIISGIGLITGFTFRFFAPIRAWAVHKAIGLSLVFAVISHIFFLLLDQYQKYSLKMILLPSLNLPWVALGIIAAYSLAIIIISSLTIIHTNKKLWKWLHFLGYIVIALIFFHALNMGTDLKSGILRYIWIGSGIIILIAAIFRYRRSFATKN